MSGSVTSPRLALVVIISIFLVGGLPPSAAAEAASAKALPGVASPGAPVTLTFTAPAPTPLDAVVMDSVTCAIRAPDGSSTPCGTTGQLITVDVSPAGRSYTFETTAPKTPGNYTIHFERKATVSAPSVDAAADATLAVLDTALDSSGTPGVVLPPVGPAISSLAGSDAARWLASATLGTATLVGLIAVVRPGGRP